MNWFELKYPTVKLTGVSEREVRVNILIKYFNIFIFNFIKSEPHFVYAP